VRLLAAAAALLLPAPPLHAGEGWIGVIFADQSAELSAETAAVVVAYHAKLGDAVAAGRPVVSLESQELLSERDRCRAELQQARARAEKAEADLADARRKLERSRQAPDLFSGEELAALGSTQRKAAAESSSAHSAIAERETALTELERQVAGLTLRAPFDGTVALCHREVGDRVAAGDALVRLISGAELWVRFAVPSGEAAGVAAGSAVRVTLPGSGQSWSATVRRVAPEIDPATDRIYAEAVLAPAEGGDPPRVGEAVRVHPAG
jgi:RND family efflux transporter MFP subunit